MKKLLATGHNGFVGQATARHLRDSLQDRDVQWCTPQRPYDMCNITTVRDLLEAHQPDWVLHLAAQSHVPTAMADPVATLLVNTVGMANLLKVLTDMQFKGRLLYVSSADVYGNVPEAMLPVSEIWMPAPRNPYASSKLAAEVLCLQWARTHSLDVVIARPFNHTGAGQSIQFALPAFARAVAEIAVGRHAPLIQTGDLGVTRDFLDVRDVVAAYLLLFRQGRCSEIYNVCSGREIHLGQALDYIMRLANTKADTVRDPSRLRPAEQRRMCGNHGKIRSATGWSPVYGLEETLQQLLDHSLQEIQG